MIRLAITGGIATGKSTALQILKELGCSVISSDAIVQELMLKDNNLKSKLKTTFNCVDENGVVDKKILGKIIFNDKIAKSKLEAMTHPLVHIVRKKFFQKCEAKGGQFAVCEIPLLFEKNLVAEFDYSILLIAGLDERIDRYILSGKGDQKKFFEITKNQMLDSEKKSKADFVIKNNGTKLQLKEKLQSTLQEIKNRHNKGK